MIIKMTNNKDLLITVPTTIYRGETQADLITFYVPAHYAGKDMTEYVATMRYVRPDGTGKFEDLNFVPSPYEDYLELSTKVNTQFAQHAGLVSTWLTFLDVDDTIVLKTGEVDVPVCDSKDVYEYLGPEDLDQFEKLATRIEELDATKADGLDFNDRVLQLTAKDKPIGDTVLIEDVSWGTF